MREISLLSICVRILMSLVVGGILGLERGRRNRPAGFRTYMLVCLGSVLVTMTNQYVFQEYGVSDPVRMGAQVISGIGFLGAGTIITDNKTRVKGITTAAGLWTAACGGLAIGVGFYEGALVGTLAILAVLSGMRRIDTFIHNHSKTVDLYIEYSPQQPFRKFILEARQLEFEIMDIQISKNKSDNQSACVLLSVRSLIKRSHPEIIEVLSSLECVEHIEELY